MKIRHSVLAVVVSSLIAAPAFAEHEGVWGGGDQADSWGNVVIDEVIIKRGFVDIAGDIEVGSQSSAQVEQSQAQVGGASDSDSSAFLGDTAMQGASGNIHANVSAGVGINQANDASLSSSNGDDTLASAMVFGDQMAMGNLQLGGASEFFGQGLTTILDGDALSNVSGNVGVNVASGVGHGQANGMAASNNNAVAVAIATTDVEQMNLGNTLDSLGIDVDVAVAIGGGVLANASGNIGLNATTGVGNLQHNGMAIASAQGGGQ